MYIITKRIAKGWEKGQVFSLHNLSDTLVPAQKHLARAILSAWIKLDMVTALKKHL